MPTTSKRVARSCIILLSLLLCSASLQAQEPVISLERTPCFGTCPDYSIEIYADGNVTYVGRNFVAVSGKQVTKIPVAEVDKLVKHFLSIDYFSLASSYEGYTDAKGQKHYVTDLPTAYTSFSWNSQHKRIKDYFGGPESLRDLERDIDRTVNSHQWIHGAHSLWDWKLVQDDVYSGIKPGLSTLMKASARWDPAPLEGAIKAGADVNGKDESGWTALMYAAEVCHARTVMTLINSGADIHADDLNGDNALVAGASGFCYLQEQMRGRDEIIRKLVSLGLDPNARNRCGETALMAAAYAGNSDAVNELLALGSDPSLVDQDGLSALDEAKYAVKRLANTSKIEDVWAIVHILDERKSPPNVK